MKSTQARLVDRGYCSDASLNEYTRTSTRALEEMLNTDVAVKRTIAARILGERRSTASLPCLCAALTIEHKLYTKIALCEAIAKFGPAALACILPLMGKIGSNQHRKVAAVDLRKRSFPLPRDIIARIVVRIGSDALPALECIVEHGQYEQAIEAIDAIGHIASTSSDLRSEAFLLSQLKAATDEVMQWKIIRALQSYRSMEVEAFLRDIAATHTHSVFRAEARRSLDRMKDSEARVSC